jgi:hypothetical protein
MNLSGIVRIEFSGTLNCVRQRNFNLKFQLRGRYDADSISTMSRNVSKCPSEERLADVCL